MEVLLYTILTLCVLGVLAAIVLYFVARKFRVEEDPRIDVVEKMLPGANCAGCVYGCLGFGDCVSACAFGALSMDPETGLPVVDADKCTACGACVKACPKGIIELRKRWPKHRAVYVSCVSKDKGAVVMKACKAGCIGCGKCVKVCSFDAIKVENNLAYIDPLKCKLCRKCVNECPTGAIRLVGMEPLPREPKAAPAAAVKPAPAKSADGESPKSE